MLLIRVVLSSFNLLKSLISLSLRGERSFLAKYPELSPSLSMINVDLLRSNLRRACLRESFCDLARDFLDVTDFLSLLELVMKKDSPNGVFNVSTGNGKSIKQVFDAVAKYLNISHSDPPLVPVGDDDVKSVVLDPSETEKTFGWKAKVSFEETINNQLMWYDKHGISAIYSHLSSKV